MTYEQMMAVGGIAETRCKKMIQELGTRILGWCKNDVESCLFDDNADSDDWGRRVQVVCAGMHVSAAVALQSDGVTGTYRWALVVTGDGTPIVTGCPDQEWTLGTGESHIDTLIMQLGNIDTYMPGAARAIYNWMNPV